MAKNILKEAIADAKAVREVALANAKAALEEAFTPKLQSMLSAKLSETLNEEEEEELEENYMDEKMDETTGMETEGSFEEGADLDEEIDLEEILNELELEEGDDSKEETVDEAKEEDLDEIKIDEEKEEVDEAAMPHPQASDISKVDYGMNVHEGESFDLDALLEEINNLDENEDDINEVEEVEEAKKEVEESTNSELNEVKNELEETKAALEVKTTELNEVNLLNSKLLYVNRIFKANTLDDAQKLRVVETLDKADCIKEAKLIYETIKDTFSVAKSPKAPLKSKTKSLREGLGMASKAAGLSTAPKREVIAGSADMVSRFQKLANIKINQ
jgi:hypothetical protein